MLESLPPNKYDKMGKLIGITRGEVDYFGHPAQGNYEIELTQYFCSS